MDYEMRGTIRVLMCLLGLVGFLLFTLVEGLNAICLFATLFYFIFVWVLLDVVGLDWREE